MWFLAFVVLPASRARDGGVPHEDRPPTSTTDRTASSTQVSDTTPLVCCRTDAHPPTTHHPLPRGSSREAARREFVKADRNGDGTLDTSELPLLIKSLSLNLNRAEVRFLVVACHGL